MESKKNSFTIENLAGKCSNKPFKITRDMGSAYSFPKYDDVPPGWYLSEVREVSQKGDRNGNEYIDICYEIVDVYKYYRHLRGTINNEPPRYKIKERYRIGTEPANLFIIHLYDVYGYEGDINEEDIVGLSEVYQITYPNDNGFGNITLDSRQYMTPDEAIEYLDSKNSEYDYYD